MAKFKLGDMFVLHIDDIIEETSSNGDKTNLYVDSRIPNTQFNEDELDALTTVDFADPVTASDSEYKIGDTFNIKISEIIKHKHSDGTEEILYKLDGIDNYYFDATDLDYFRGKENSISTPDEDKPIECAHPKYIAGRFKPGDPVRYSLGRDGALMEGRILGVNYHMGNISYDIQSPDGTGTTLSVPEECVHEQDYIYPFKFGIGDMVIYDYESTGEFPVHNRFSGKIIDRYREPDSHLNLYKIEHSLTDEVSEDLLEFDIRPFEEYLKGSNIRTPKYKYKVGQKIIYINEDLGTQYEGVIVGRCKDDIYHINRYNVKYRAYDINTHSFQETTSEAVREDELEVDPYLYPTEDED